LATADGLRATLPPAVLSSSHVAPRHVGERFGIVRAPPVPAATTMIEDHDDDCL